MSDKKVGTVYESTEYSKFKFAEGNRPVVTKGVKWNRLVESMKKKGQLEPAVVSAGMVVKNGQHRLKACELLGIPYKYVLGGQIDGADDIADANSSKAWGMKDYVQFYAAQTNPESVNYKYFLALLKEFDITISALAQVLGSYGGDPAERLEKGGLKLSTEKYEAVRKCLTELKALGFDEWRKTNNYASRAFWTAATYAWRHPKVDLSRLIDVLNRNAYRIPTTNRPKEFLRAASELYNYRLGQKKKVYLDVDWAQKKYLEWF